MVMIVIRSKQLWFTVCLQWLRQALYSRERFVCSVSIGMDGRGIDQKGDLIKVTPFEPPTLVVAQRHNMISRFD